MENNLGDQDLYNKLEQLKKEHEQVEKDETDFRYMAQTAHLSGSSNDDYFFSTQANEQAIRAQEIKKQMQELTDILSFEIKKDNFSEFAHAILEHIQINEGEIARETKNYVVISNPFALWCIPKDIVLDTLGKDKHDWYMIYSSIRGGIITGAERCSACLGDPGNGVGGYSHCCSAPVENCEPYTLDMYLVDQERKK